MMRFGKHSSPVLLEALGMLLQTGPFDSDGKRLAARAFLRASYESADEQVAADYRRLARGALFDQSRSSTYPESLELKEVEEAFKKELAEARSWFEDQICKDESQWIADGSDVDLMFDEKYREEPQLADSPDAAARHNLLYRGQPTIEGASETAVIGFAVFVVLAAAGFTMVCLRGLRG